MGLPTVMTPSDHPSGECFLVSPLSGCNSQERLLWVSGTVLLPAWNAAAKYAGDSLAGSSGKQPQPTGLWGGGGREKGSCLSWKNWSFGILMAKDSLAQVGSCTAEHSTPFPT